MIRPPSVSEISPAFFALVSHIIPFSSRFFTSAALSYMWSLGIPLVQPPQQQKRAYQIQQLHMPAFGVRQEYRIGLNLLSQITFNEYWPFVSITARVRDTITHWQN